VQEGRDRRPVGVRGLAGPDPLEGGVRRGEPGLVAALLGDLPAVGVGHLEADHPRARGDQREARDAVGVPDGVQQRRRGPGGVREQVEPLQPEVRAQRLDVGDLTVAPTTVRVRRDGGVPGAPQVQQHQ
jgi:hypothetical protein